MFLLHSHKKWYSEASIVSIWKTNLQIFFWSVCLNHLFLKLNLQFSSHTFEPLLPAIGQNLKSNRLNVWRFWWRRNLMLRHRWTHIIHTCYVFVSTNVGIHYVGIHGWILELAKNRPESGLPQWKDFSLQTAKPCMGRVNINSIYYAIFSYVYCLSLLSNPTLYVGSTMQITCGNPDQNSLVKVQPYRVSQN